MLTGPPLTLGPMKPREQTLGEIAFTNLRAKGYGTMRAMKGAADALTTAGALAIAASRSQNGFPTQAEYATYWKQSERSAQREWRRFKDAFPSEEGPERLARLLVAEYSRRLAEREDPSIAFSLPASVLSAG
jgi:hypothetical protein